MEKQSADHETGKAVAWPGAMRYERTVAARPVISQPGPAGHRDAFTIRCPGRQEGRASREPG